MHNPKAYVLTPAWIPKNAALVVLPCAFEPTTIPENTDPELYKQYFRRCEVYLIGTAHRDTKCNTDVQTAIRKLRPDGIFLEQPDTEGGRRAVLIDFGWQDEFRIAYKEAKALKIPKNRVVLARYSGHDDEFKQFLTANVDSRFRSEKPALYKALVTERDLFMTHGLMKMMNEVAATEYISTQRKGKAVRLIAVVGAGHLRGIVSNWGRHISDGKIESLLM
ncbi:hypothetical protein AAVH_05015 [Aphelenchoides avenae]|nr:hypothetical protein AAVH_05015 [Aphelenchus avenae]